HVLDLGANYWSLWTEGANLKRYHERYPRGFTTLQQRMGYRVRPSWVWQRKRYGTSEVVHSSSSCSRRTLRVDEKEFRKRKPKKKETSMAIPPERWRCRGGEIG